MMDATGCRSQVYSQPGAVALDHRDWVFGPFGQQRQGGRSSSVSSAASRVEKQT